MSLIVKSAVKDSVELNVAEETLDELDKKVGELVKKAEKRAKENQRRTIFARDL